jgi:hypothetical protein
VQANDLEVSHHALCRGMRLGVCDLGTDVYDRSWPPFQSAVRRSGDREAFTLLLLFRDSEQLSLWYDIPLLEGRIRRSHGCGGVERIRGVNDDWRAQAATR